MEKTYRNDAYGRQSLIPVEFSKIVSKMTVSPFPTTVSLTAVELYMVYWTAIYIDTNTCRLYQLYIMYSIIYYSIIHHRRVLHYSDSIKCIGLTVNTVRKTYNQRTIILKIKFLHNSDIDIVEFERYGLIMYCPIHLSRRTHT